MKTLLISNAVLTQRVKDESQFEALKTKQFTEKPIKLTYFQCFGHKLENKGFFHRVDFFSAKDCGIQLLVNKPEIRSIQHSIGMTDIWLEYQGYAIPLSSYSRINANIPKFGHGMKDKFIAHAKGMIETYTKTTQHRSK